MGGVGRRARRSRVLGAVVVASGLYCSAFGLRSADAFLAGPATSAVAGRSGAAVGSLGQESRPVSPANAPADVPGATQASSLLAPIAAAAAAFGVTARHVGRSTSQSRSSGADAAVSAAPGSDDVPEWLPRALLFLFALFCSTNFTLLKVLEDQHGEAAVACARFGLAALPFMPFVSKHSDWLSIRSGVEVGLWCAFAYLCQAVGLPETDASSASFITSLAMIVVPIAKAFTGGKVAAQLWGSVLLAVFGTGMLVGVGGDVGPNHGDLLCGGCALGFGLMFFRLDAFSKQKGFDDVGCTIWQVITLAISSAIWLLCTAGPSGAMTELAGIATGGPETLATLAWVGLVTTAGVLYVETWAMKRIDGTEAGIIFASEPVWATLFAAVVLHETLGMHEVVGAAFIIMACLLTEVKMDDVLGALRGESKELTLPRAVPAAAVASVGLLADAAPTGAF